MGIMGCPWCGEVPEMHTTRHGGFFLACDNYACPVQPWSQSFSTKEKLIRMWNRRMKKGGLKMLVEVKINNAPDGLDSENGYEVARYVDGKLWHYGIYESEKRARCVAEEIGNGLVLKVGDPE